MLPFWARAQPSLVLRERLSCLGMPRRELGSGCQAESITNHVRCGHVECVCTLQIIVTCMALPKTIRSISLLYCISTSISVIFPDPWSFSLFFGASPKLEMPEDTAAIPAEAAF